MRTSPILAGFLLVAATPIVAAPKVTSAYTGLDLDHCTRLDRGETPESTEWRCSGHRGVALFVQNGDDRYDVDAGVEDEDALWADTFDYPGKTVEWRLSGGKPFAIIYRLEFGQSGTPPNDEAGGRNRRNSRPPGLPRRDDPRLGQERESAGAIGRRSPAPDPAGMPQARMINSPLFKRD